LRGDYADVIIASVIAVMLRVVELCRYYAACRGGERRGNIGVILLRALLLPFDTLLSMLRFIIDDPLTLLRHRR